MENSLTNLALCNFIIENPLLDISIRNEQGTRVNSIVISEFQDGDELLEAMVSKKCYFVIV